MDFEDEKFIKREQSDDLLFEAYDEPVKSRAIKLAKQALEINSVHVLEQFFQSRQLNIVEIIMIYM